LKTKVAAITAPGAITDVVTVQSITIGNVGSTQVKITTNAKNLLPAVTDWGNY
jgi:hypothetical protein